jgi:hypothetical protein
MLIDPCSPKWEFYNPREMGDLFIDNFYCIESFQVKLQSLRDWKKQQQSIYNNQESN